MTELEKAFGDAEDIANGVARSAASVASQAKAMAKAAKTGSIAGIKRGQGKLVEALAALEEDVQTAKSCWPYAEDDEQALLEQGFRQELEAAAESLGLKMYEQDGRLVSYPSILRILPPERAVQIDRKKVSTIRPSFLADLLLKNQKKSSGFSSQRFLEALYSVYSNIVGASSPSMVSTGSSRVVALIRIYKLMTALPGATRDYDRSDFARDIYALDAHGPHQTRNGATVAFPAATGTRIRSSDLFSFVGPDGNRVEYYGIRFSEHDK